MPPMLRCRRPTNKAYAGVLCFNAYAVHAACNYGHTAQISSAAAMISAFFLFVEPLSQPQSYHNFADKRRFLCSCHGATGGFFLPPGAKSERVDRGFVIPHFGDVVSNAVILLGGASGIILLRYQDSDGEEMDPIRAWQLRVCLPIFFYSTVAISVGSTYYHWKPNNSSLVWDRLPMTLAFVSILCFIIEEYSTVPGIGQTILYPLLCVGVFSVVYWHFTDDLRLYALVQFLPLIIMAVLLLSCEPRHGGAVQHAVALACYAFAKVCEDKDYEIYSLTNNCVSGHSLKHVIAGSSSIIIASSLLKK